MNLTQIEIECYKSLVGQTFTITDRCMSFVGLNESGKTNVLNAIRMLDWNYEPTLKERSKLNDCLPTVIFHFEDLTSDTATKILTDEISKLDLPLGDNLHIITPDSIKISSLRVTRKIQEEGDASDSIDFNIDFDFTSKGFMIIEEEPVFPSDPQPASSDNPDSVLTINKEMQVGDEVVSLEKGLILKADQIADTHLSYFTELTKENIIEIIRPLIEEALEERIPTVVYWEYNDKYLIPSEITYDDFLKDGEPSEVSEPLYNIFMISSKLRIHNVDELIARVEDWKINASRRRKDSQIINDAVNKYIKKIWKEYDQSIVIDLESSEITIHVRDPKSPSMNFYEMVERSQGFKTFVSFLLTVAAESHLEIMDNYILILDEPETHLHPSGVRFMKQELLKLAEQGNHVFFATHSIFMIDRKKLDRHVIVKKIEEYSCLKKVERNNITQESVIYEALGTQVDEFSINMKNLMFEGSIDRTLFQFFVENCHEKRGNTLLDYDFLDGGGTSEILKFFKDKVIPKESKWCLILDNDKPAQKLVDALERMFAAEFDTYFKVKNYSTKTDYELEDLLPIVIVENAFNSALRKFVSDENIKLSLDGKKPVSAQVEELKGRQNIKGELGKSIEKEFKVMIESDVLTHLKEVKKGTSIDKRKKLFQEAFNGYFVFVEKYIEEVTNADQT